MGIVSWDYLAGFVDGEGCFSAYHHRNTRLHLSITNTDFNVLDDISKFIEDRIGIRNSVRTTSNDSTRRTCYRIYLGPPTLRLILPQLKERLIVKKFQAEIMLEILDIVKERKQWLSEIRTVGILYNRRSEENERTLEILIDKLRWANKGYK